MIKCLVFLQHLNQHLINFLLPKASQRFWGLDPQSWKIFQTLAVLQRLWEISNSDSQTLLLFFFIFCNFTHFTSFHHSTSVSSWSSCTALFTSASPSQRFTRLRSSTMRRVFFRLPSGPPRSRRKSLRSFCRQKNKGMRKNIKVYKSLQKPQRAINSSGCSISKAASSNSSFILEQCREQIGASQHSRGIAHWTSEKKLYKLNSILNDFKSLNMHKSIKSKI